MSEAEKMNCNQMVFALQQISNGYQKPDQIWETCEDEFGLEYEEALEMAYENLQLTAKNCLTNLSTLK